MKIPHPHLPKVPGMILVEVRAVVMLPTRHTATTGVFSMFADTAMAGGDVTATIIRGEEKGIWLAIRSEAGTVEENCGGKQRQMLDAFVWSRGSGG